MERKRTFTSDKTGSSTENEFLPKVPVKIKDSPYSSVPVKAIRSKYSELNSAYGDSEINIFSKFLKTDSNSVLIVPKSADDRKANGLHLPVLSKKENKREIIASIINYRSPTLSPCYTRENFKRIEADSPYPEEDQKQDCQKDPLNELPKRGSSASRGYKYRKAKLKPTVNSTKQRDANLDILLMCRDNSDLSFLMQEYSRRQGLNEVSKVFILTGQHDFMRRALKKRNWVENKNVNSCAYHLKWCYNDSEYDYKNLKEGQLYNHFQNNRELTTKSGLSKNLRNVTDCRVNIDTFFPRCYDLGDSFQLKELINDYKRTSILNLIKKAVKGYLIDDAVLEPVKAFANQLIAEAFSKCEKQKKQAFALSPEMMQKILDYSPMKTEKASIYNNEIFEIHKKLEGIYPQYTMEGCENIWIIKPGQNARGSGVRCVKGLEEILDSGSKMQSRVVQKYTESPLLLPLSIGPCKFDLRIWVLVTSFDPLSIYMYNTCYCRLCQEPYTLDSLDAFKHLANYSIQKSIAKSQSDTIWTLSQLISHLTAISVPFVPILTNIHYLIVQTLIAVVDGIENRAGCFELYGFDIILDETFKPWLLEVNLSPACAERNEWITQTLNSMGEGMLQILLDKITLEPIYDANLRPVKQIIENSQEWVFIYKGDSSGEDYSLTKVNLEIFGEKFNVKRERNMEKRFVTVRAALAIQKKTRKFLVKVREEKKKINHSVLGIQKIIRRKLAYDEFFRRLRNLSAIKIQSIWRMELGKRQLCALKKIKCIEVVQGYFRSLKARNEFKELKIIRSCVYIQTVLRRKFDEDEVISRKYYLKCVKLIQKHLKHRYRFINQKALSIQRCIRGFLSRVKVRKIRVFLKSVINIQKSTRRFLALKKTQQVRINKAGRIISKYEKLRLCLSSFSYYIKFRSAIIIQKYWRRHAAKKVLLYKKQQKLIFIQYICFIQKTLKGMIERRKFKQKIERKAAVCIQRVFKGYRCRKYSKVLRTVNKAAIIIQKYFRGFKCRKKYLLMKRIYNEEKEKKTSSINKRKEQEYRAIKASERLFRGKGAPELPTTVSKIGKPQIECKETKIERMKNIYALNDDPNYCIDPRYERNSLIKDIIEEMRPKKDKAKSRKNKKRGSSSNQNGRFFN